MIKRIGKAIMVLLLTTPALLSMELMAQDLKKPTLEDLLPGGATYRIAENLPGLQWWGDIFIVCRQPQKRKGDIAHDPGKGKSSARLTDNSYGNNRHTQPQGKQSTAFLQYRVPVAGQAVYAYQAACEIHRL